MTPESELPKLWNVSKLSILKIQPLLFEPYNTLDSMLGDLIHINPAKVSVSISNFTYKESNLEKFSEESEY